MTAVTCGLTFGRGEFQYGKEGSDGSTRFTFVCAGFCGERRKQVGGLRYRASDFRAPSGTLRCGTLAEFRGRGLQTGQLRARMSS